MTDSFKANRAAPAALTLLHFPVGQRQLGGPIQDTTEREDDLYPSNNQELSETKERKGTMRNVKSIIAIGGVSAAMGIAALTGCSNLQSPIKKETAADGRSEGRVLDDSKITKSVEDRLKAEPVYKFGSVEVKTYGGIVQLSGFVDEAEQKRRAEEIARSVGGVSQVMNALVLKPESTLSPTGQTSGQRLTPPPSETAQDNPNPNK